MKWLNDFDFDFRSRPVDFRWNEKETREEASRHGVKSLKDQPRQRTLFKRFSAPPLRLLGVEASRHGVTLLKEQPKQRSLYERLSALLLQLLGAIVVRTFGRRLVYPGSLGLLQNSICSQLHEGRAKLVEEFHGQRAKLQACDDNHIDCMFVDRRGTRSAEGGILVICCEGNAGFYEIGCMATPLQGNYSVLGWNHPGFASSTVSNHVSSCLVPTRLCFTS
uniref:Uncharacterized protein n=1 Tax=Eptatretus burgeri TaxID=7764 RepID=A0A8C4RAC3_EPTBU